VNRQLYDSAERMSSGGQVALGYGIYDCSESASASLIFVDQLQEHEHLADQPATPRVASRAALAHHGSHGAAQTRIYAKQTAEPRATSYTRATPNWVCRQAG